MTKSDNIREALRKKPGSTYAEIIAASGVKNLGGYIKGMLKTGEVVADGDAGARTHRLDPNYTPKRKSPEQKKTKKKRAPAMKQRLREIAAKAKAGAPLGDLRALSIEALRTSGKHLLKMVRECVDMEDSPELAHAAASFEIADRIYQASLH